MQKAEGRMMNGEDDIAQVVDHSGEEPVTQSHSDRVSLRTPTKSAKKNDIRERAFEFACRVVRLHYLLSKRNATARPLWSQLLNAGTSVGANLEEAEAGQSKADFVAKCRIALKEARESLYWLRLLSGSGIVPHSRLADLQNEADEIVAILTTIVRNAGRSPTR